MGYSDEKTLTAILMNIFTIELFFVILMIMHEKSENYSEKIEHLNLALRAIRDVNRLLIRVKDRKRLLQNICNILVKNRGYNKVWLIVLDASHMLDEYAETGIGKDFLPIVEEMKRGKFVDCAQRAIEQTKTVLIKNPPLSCTDCPLSLKHADWGTITAPLIHEKKRYGLMSVSIPKELISEDIEQALVEEIAGDIAFGLYRIRQEEEHKRAETALKKRVKELNYVFSFSSLVEKPNVSLEQILQGAVDLIPSAMQFPETTCARITLEHQEFKTAGFKKTDWMLSHAITFHNEKIGLLEVGFLKKPDADTGPFIKEEKKLINTIAVRAGKVIERKRDRKALELSEKQFRDLVENSHTCISIIQNNRIVYQNPEHKRLFGTRPDFFIFNNFDMIHPDDVEEARYSFIDIESGKIENADIEFRFFPAKNSNAGTEMIWVHCRLSSIEYQGKEAILVNLMDISHTKKLEHLLRIQDKMTSLGRVAAGIAHEIRNPLSGINIYLKAMEKVCTKTENPEKVAKILFQLQSASNKIESVIKRVMDFSRPGEPSFMMIDINQPAEEAINLSSVTLRKSEIQLDINLASNLPKCNADSHMIEQVILNLIANASEAMKNKTTGKRITISTLLENDTVCIEVCDSGPGVPEHLKNMIFDPFYTTKKHSSGIGLSISHRIITDHGGILDVLSSTLGGAKFIVKIPGQSTEKL